LLDAPTVAGQRFAVSTKHAGLGPMDVEIWGTNAECGVAEQLLWWGPMVTGTQCGEFTPSASYSHLLYVYRQQYDVDTYGFSMPELTLCADGTCPSGPTGEGLEPGKEPIGAPLVYEDSTRSIAGGFHLRLDLYGNVVAFVDAATPGTPSAITQGVFRMPRYDRFGDAWYCMGEGSTITQIPGEDFFDRDTYAVSLKNITKLKSCATLNGTGDLSIFMDATGGAITGSLSPFAGSKLNVSPADCIDTACTFGLSASEAPYGERYAFVDAAESAQAPLDPMGMPVAVNGAMLLATADGSVTLACSASGSIEHDPVDTTTVILDAVASVTCPGEPLDDDTFEFTTLPP